ncbi:hypothetical protein [Methylobacterium sp.]|uniref:hypothetical protein n=1 Tax=Methylobacterium sp. TaxID=409 RepID=UPI003B58E08A
MVRASDLTLGARRLNIGGAATSTIVDFKRNDLAFDSRSGNTLVDGWMRERNGGRKAARVVQANHPSLPSDPPGPIAASAGIA